MINNHVFFSCSNCELVGPAILNLNNILPIVVWMYNKFKSWWRKSLQLPYFQHPSFAGFEMMSKNMLDLWTLVIKSFWSVFLIKYCNIWPDQLILIPQLFQLSCYLTCSICHLQDLTWQSLTCLSCWTISI